MVKGVWTGSRGLASLVLVCLAASATASPGNGIRLGGSSGRLHPYLELETRWDSNIAFSDQGQAQSGFILHVRPGLVLEAPGDPAALDLRANLDWAQYMGKNSDLSRLYGEAQLGVGLNRKGTVGLEVTDSFRRASSTQALNFGGALVSNTNRLDLAVPFRSGGGAFVTTVSGGWELESFEPFSTGRLCPANTPACDPNLVSKLGYSDVSAGLDLRWKFLPRTAALLQGEYWTRLPASSSLGVKASGFRSWAGLAGLFTAHLAGTVKGGYGMAYNAPGSIATWLANLEAEWLPYDTAGLKVGYLHDLGVDPGQDGGFTSHRAYVDGHVLLSGRYTTELASSYEHRIYSRAGFTADLFTAGPSVEAEVARWLRVGAGYAYTKRTSQLPAGTPNLPGFKFDKSEVYLRVRGTY
jgi:hypothetical protein